MSIADVVARLIDEAWKTMNAGLRKRGMGEEAVNRLRGTVRAGIYEVDSHVVAEAMLARVGLWSLSGDQDGRSRGRATRRRRPS